MNYYKGPEAVFQIGESVVFAGPIASSKKGVYDLIVDLTGATHNRSYVTTSLDVEGLEVKQDYISVRWPDMGVPALKREWWETLASVLASGKFDSIYIGCAGGVGRTGTTLAILAYLYGVETKTPIAWVRENYNPKAVETTEQVEYVNKITGNDEKVDVRSGKSYGVGYGSYGYGYGGQYSTAKQKTPNEFYINDAGKLAKSISNIVGGLKNKDSFKVEHEDDVVYIEAPGSWLMVKVGPRYELKVVIDGQYVDVISSTTSGEVLSKISGWALVMDEFVSELVSLGIGIQCFDENYASYGIVTVEQIIDGPVLDELLDEFVYNNDDELRQLGCLTGSKASGKVE